MLTRAGLDVDFWEYAFKCAIHLINRLPTYTFSPKIPYELFYKKTPTYGYLRTFGCLCYPFIRTYASYKLEPRSIPCVFMGYPPNYKAY